MHFFEFANDIREKVFPDGWAENLKENYRDIIVDALIELQQKVQCLQSNHEDYFPACGTFYSCGASIIEAPRGFIKSIHTVSSDDDCCEKVQYEPVSKAELDCLIKQQVNSVPVCSGSVEHSDGTYTSGGYDYTYPTLPLPCFEFPTAETDKACRATKGYVALDRRRIWMWPHLQSDEQAVVIWDGVKRDWQNTDEMDETIWDREAKQAVELYLEAESARKFDCDSGHYATAFNSFTDKVALLIWQCTKERRIPKRAYCFSNC